MKTAKPARLLAVALLVATACSAPAANSSASASPSAGASATATPAASPTIGASATPSATPIAILPGEPWIAFQWLQDCGEGCFKQGIHLIRPDGRDHHLLLTEEAEHPDWSPDGQRLAVYTVMPTGAELWIVAADGTNHQVVECDGAPCRNPAAPAWSPDARRLAFWQVIPPGTGEQYERNVITVVDLATGDTRIVADPPAIGAEDIQYIYPRWSPDGTEIVFTVMRYPVPATDENIQGSSIAIVKADGSDAEAPRVLTDPAMFGAYPDWSPDGTRILFQTYPLGSFQTTTKATNLYTIRPDGTGLTQVTHFGESDTRAVEPTWTPDGKRIIFTNIAGNPTNPEGERYVALIDADGTDVTLIPIPPELGAPSPVWYGTHARLRPTP
jgi:dipeptidyl aminopeptidase/acylaminoacyl peptidase